MIESPADGNTLPLDFLKQILALAAEPARAKAAVCEQARRLAAARAAAVVEQGPGGPALTVRPAGRRGVPGPAAAEAFCRRLCADGRPGFWRRAAAAPGDGLAALGVENCLAAPLRAGGLPIGSLLVFDCGEARDLAALGQALETLAGVLGLVLQGAGVRLEAERLAGERTRQLARSEQTLREAHRRYDELAARIPAGVYRLRFSAGGGFGFEYVSPRFAEMLDLSVEECLSGPDALAGRLHPDDRADFLQKCERCRAALAPFSAEARFLAGGGVKWMLVESTPTPTPDGGSVWHGVVTDISASKRMEAELRAGEARFKAIFDQAAVGLAQVDSLTGRFVWVNPRYCDIAGLTPERMLASTFMDITHPDDLPLDLENMERLRRGELRSFSMEKRYLRPDGTVWVNLTVSPLWAPGEPPGCHIAVALDITERKRAEERLRLTARVFDATLEGIVITDGRGGIIEVNEAFTRITGYAREEVLGKNPRLLHSGLHDAAFYAAMWRSIEDTGHWSGEVWNRRKNGEVYPEWLSVSAIAGAGGAATHYVGISSDITLLKQHERRLEQIAHYDALTGIPNRVLLVDRMRQGLAQARREGSLLAVCYLDLDGFKPVNDTLGHEAGDAVLVEVAQRVGAALRGSDTVARLGGDEFVVLLQGVESAGDCHTSLNRLLQTIAQPIAMQGRQFSVTASIGVTLFPLDDEDPDTLLRHADQAMYLAKQLGKNRYRLYDPSQDLRFRHQLEQRRRVEEGLAAGEFEVFYQPQVAMPSRRVVGVEALVRWRHPQKGLLLPAEFLPLLENSELEIRLGRWIVDAALAQLEGWQRRGLPLSAGVNIAAAHLLSPDFVEHLRRSLARRPGLPAGRLQIEIQEVAALSDISSVAGIIEECTGLGVRFALDDFGTGHSTLAYLRSLPADTLKIDQGFVRDMLEDAGDRSIVQGVIALAHSFRRKAVAEGVETAEHFRVLGAMGCDIGQGYGIAPPMPAGELERWCRRALGQAEGRAEAAPVQGPPAAAGASRPSAASSTPSSCGNPPAPPRPAARS